VRGAAAAALAAAFVVPLVRKRKRIPPAVTTAALAAGPPALAVLSPRTRLRDAGMHALQMWMFTLAHELPYDDPERAASRLRVGYPIRLEDRSSMESACCSQCWASLPVRQVSSR